MGELSNVLWIGGPAAAGKTTVSRLLARRHGLRWYSVDDHTWQYWDRAEAAGIALPSDGPGDFDRGPMIREDLLAMPWPLVVVEGAFVSPELARPAGHAVWLMPSQEEQRARLEKRHPKGVHHGYLWGWQLIRSQLDAAPDAATIVVDGQSVGQTIAAVERHFAELIAAGPTARSRVERQDLLRYANEVALTHSMTARRPVPPGAGEAVRTFDCECAAPTCDALVDLPGSEAAAALADPPPALLAPGHH
ncbi:P-loop nucleotide/nucleoside kinase family protein [Flindersiella endophytica]